jgi:hypothetical protein
MRTHYIPAFTVFDGVLQRAVCGEFITTAQHSAEPTCPACAQWFIDLDKQPAVSVDEV